MDYTRTETRPQKRKEENHYLYLCFICGKRQAINIANIQLMKNKLQLILIDSWRFISSIYPSVYLCIYISTYLPIYLSFYLSSLPPLSADLVLSGSSGRLHGLTGSAVGHRSITTGFKPGRAMSEGCFIFHFDSLPLEVARPI